MGRGRRADEQLDGVVHAERPHRRDDDGSRTPPCAARVIAKAAGSLDFFLKDYGDDGCCEEGVLYYRHAGLCLFNAAAILDSVMGGGVRAPIWAEAKIRNIADYIVNMHVDGRTYFNFADCSAKVPACSSREFLFGRRVGSDRLMAFGRR